MIRESGLSLLAMVTVVFALILSGCGSGPPPKLYLLDGQLLEPIEPTPDVPSLTALGISQVALPGYASDARIASRGADGVVALNDSRRWAEEPEAAITRLLAKRLRLRGSATVLIEPWPRDYEPQARVEVMFDRLLHEPDGGAQVAGQIQLLSGDGRRLLKSEAFDFKTTVLSTETSEFFRAVAFGVDEIARLAIEALLQLRLKS